MNESIDVASAIALALVVPIVTWAIVRFLLWRDGLLPRAERGRDHERRASNAF